MFPRMFPKSEFPRRECAHFVGRNSETHFVSKLFRAFMLNVILDATAMQDVIVEMLDFVMDSQRDLDGRLGKDVWRYE
jgi:hypothetical protein